MPVKTPNILNLTKCHMEGKLLKEELHVLDSYINVKRPIYDVNDTYPKMKDWKTEGGIADCCLWDGVSCDTASGYVIAIDLSSSWLHGPLTSNSSLFRLLHLQKLNLAFNDFASCTIPSDFGQLSSTSDGYLYVRQEQLGRLITQNMTNLRQLYLDGTNLSSPVPEFFGNLSSLTYLSLRKCYLFGELPEKIFLQLPNLQFIDLSTNSGLEGTLPEFRSGSMVKLLDLSHTNFFGKLPDSIGNLKSLEYLDLRKSNFSGIIPPSLWNLSQLSNLSLSQNHFSGQLPYTIANLGKLTEIRLSENNFGGGLPSSLGNLRQLNYLNLGHNNFSSQVPTSLGNLTQLKFLSLGYNSLSGQIPSSLGNLTQLKVLHLEENRFSGKIPSSLGKLAQLEILSLSSNFLDGELPISFPHSIKNIYLYYNNLTGSIPSTSVANLTFLEALDLSYNFFTGVIPLSLFKLPSLESLSLDDNKLTGSLNTSNLSQLTYLSLSGNKLSGVPSSVSKLTMLIDLYLSFNDFSGILDFGIFSALSSLEYLDLSNNTNLSFTNTTTKSLPNFLYLHLSSCSNITELPLFLKTQAQLQALDLSNNRIGGQIPKWFLSFGTETMQQLNLSHNFLTGWEETPVILPWKSLFVLDLHSNMLQGPLVVPLISIWYYSVSENSLTGRIDPLFCKLDGLIYLELSSNNLSGTIPQCFGKLASSLSVLNLRDNNLHGKMPTTCGEGSQLVTLDLSHNHLHGKIPKSLAECRRLEFVRASSSGITSMAQNSNAKRYIGNYDEDQYYSMTVINKGQEMGFIRVLSIFVSIDLSNNRFHGQIPTTTGGLGALVVLNLSSNSFTGHIPSSLRNLTRLESLDFSNNKLSGEIPQQLNSLTFLGYLNMSENEFVGPIPQGGQIGTFPNSSFLGNLGLCGRPLSKMCETTLSSTPSPNINVKSAEDSIMSGFTWKVVAIGYGCGVVFGVVGGHVIISRRPYLMWIIFRVITQRRRRR
ncbi:hypothetical protein FNV43_RR21120 [Rhamnella rubrinervis]|uniref:Disease resistance R13L4/SHOC-2-like LRR domain-containing protein n=1 Tax=Rhamnella rubrinervis TaxID=2594499 RepID=A0A8K0GV57_9ROSA|nr:hypothetical protein FNV43_RR21120 [Rhamnella rubrinervis]